MRLHHIMRQGVQQTDHPDLADAVHRHPGKPAVLHLGMRMLGQLAPPIDRLAVLARHPRPPVPQRVRLVFALPLPLAQGLGGDIVAFPTDDGGVDLKCPTEIAISDRREHELARSGLIPIIHRKNTDKAAFIGAQSVYRPKNTRARTALRRPHRQSQGAPPYMFAVSRFAHYLKCMVRDKIGTMKEKEALQRWLQEWIYEYVDGDPVNSSEETKAESRSPTRAWMSSRTKRTRATTRRASICGRTISSKGWTSDESGVSPAGDSQG